MQQSEQVSANEPAVLRAIRVEAELDKWFNEHFPWRGSFPQFVNDALKAFRREWGDRLPPHQAVDAAISNVAKQYGG